MKNDVLRATPATEYASLTDGAREDIEQAQRYRILAESYKGSQQLFALGQQILTEATARALSAMSFADPDVLGRYAAFLLEKHPPLTKLLLLFDGSYRLLATEVLSSGPEVDIRDTAYTIPERFQASGAVYAALAFSPVAGEFGYTREDDIFAAKLSRYCETVDVPIIECIVAWTNHYRPLFRTYGYVQRTYRARVEKKLQKQKNKTERK